MQSIKENKENIDKKQENKVVLIIGIFIIAICLVFAFLLSKPIFKYLDIIKQQNEPEPSFAMGHPLADRSFILGVPCEPPCWHGLNINQSKHNEVSLVLDQLDFVDQATLKVLEYSGEGRAENIEIYYECPYSNGTNCGFLNIRNDELIIIRYRLGYVLTFQDVVDKLGPPDFVEIAILRECNINFIWIQPGIMASLEADLSQMICRDAREIEGRVSGDLPISNLSYVSNQYIVDCNISECYPWTGFAINE